VHRLAVGDHEGPPVSGAQGSKGDRDEVARFAVSTGPSIASTIRITDALRSALMSKLGDRCPPAISGRTENGPLRMVPAHAHAFFLAEDADGDGFVDHLLVYGPGGFNKTTRRAMDSLARLWTTSRRDEAKLANHEWQVALEVVCPAVDLATTSRLFGFAAEWVSVTPYLKPRYDRKAPRDFDERLMTYREQIQREWGQRFPKAPLPHVDAIEANGPFGASLDRRIEPREFVRTRGGRGGHQPDAAGGFFRVKFPRPVSGPIALGKHAHFGMGLFERAESRNAARKSP
jgi:CRISPR-associated protein Csb2